ncbi:MAG: 50S ribosomal protein L21 [Limnochordia bacterium]|nr:50S ribosomal protein L21 [Limnochordia bacterium]MDD2628796.1 50S ribosomal protein L21 [Limnochordia bacterium]MDD4518238.1 50S ribosomal protein L21 [Limnochordia bacterium]
MRYAVVQTGGKQYRVSEGQELFVEKLGAEEGTTVELEDVLLVVEDGKVNTGNPFVDGAKVVATVVKNGKSPKVVVFKYKPKKNYRRKYGHRQPYTKLRIEQIVG